MPSVDWIGGRVQSLLNDMVLSAVELLKESDAFFSTRKSDGMPEKLSPLTVSAIALLSTSKVPTSRKPTEIEAAKVPAVRLGQLFGSFTRPALLTKI